jgi:hypothetical protein
VEDVIKERAQRTWMMEKTRAKTRQPESVTNRRRRGGGREDGGEEVDRERKEDETFMFSKQGQILKASATRNSQISIDPQTHRATQGSDHPTKLNTQTTAACPGHAGNATSFVPF